MMTKNGNIFLTKSLERNNKFYLLKIDLIIKITFQYAFFLFKKHFSSIFFDKRMGEEVDIDELGEEFKGYKVKITGGNDK